MNKAIKATPSVVVSNVKEKVGEKLGCGRLTLVGLVEADLPEQLRTEAANRLIKDYCCYDAEVMTSGNVRLTRSLDDID